MCLTCGCSDPGGVRVTAVGEPARRHVHDHEQDHPHGHGHSHDGAGPDAVATRLVSIEQDLLAKNDDLAAHNRGWLAERDMAALNLMSSPGAGKTSLLERTIRETSSGRTICVVEGDQETLFDAERIKATGASVVQVNTGAGCHLDAEMLHQAMVTLDPPEGALLLVENVGNLVCPALFDLGEAAKVVVISVTEGDDKALKYPHMFAAADLVIVNKIDLLPYVDFDVERCARDARSLHPAVGVLPLSVRTGEGIGAWYAWLGTL